MTYEALVTSAVVVAIVTVLSATRVQPYIALLGALTVLMLAGVLPMKDAIAGFSNEGMITVGALFVVAAGLRDTGVLARAVPPILGRSGRIRTAQARLIAPTLGISAFLNNTPLVAMLIPVVTDWARRTRLPLSQLMIPLSYAAVLGGLVTLIGTSTNLVVHGLLLEAGLPGFSLFDVTPVGLPIALAGAAFLVVFGAALLPKTGDGTTVLENAREYTLEMVVPEGSPLVGKTIEQAGLRHLPGIFLAEIHRRGHVIAAVAPTETMEADDQLIFVGMIDSVIDLQRTAGLRPATTQLFKLDAPRSERWFVEAVVGPSNPVVGKNIREGRFRNRYGAVVLAVARGGKRIDARIGDIVVEAGDVLLLEALPSFVEQQRRSSEFYLVSRIEDAQPQREERAPIAALVMIAMVVVGGAGWLPMLEAAWLAAGAMLLAGCVSEEAARRSIDWPLLLTIGAAFGVGKALETSGAAASVANAMLSMAGDHPWSALAVIYLTTVVVSEVVTNNAAAVILFPIAMQTAGVLGVSYLPFVVAVMMGASAAFATPLGYQTHLMVYGPGGYRFGDFVRIGVPLDLVLAAVAMLVIPAVFPF